MLYKDMSKEHRINLLKKVIREDNYFKEEKIYWQKHLNHKKFQDYSSLSEAELKNIYMHFLYDYEHFQLDPDDYYCDTWAEDNGY